MSVRAKEGTCLAALARMAVSITQAAEKQCPRRGPGRPPVYKDWQIDAMILIGVLARRKSKSAQYRFLADRRREVASWVGLERFPSRGTFFERYRSAHRLLEAAIRVQGRWAIREGLADARTVAVDQSLIRARGRLWHRRDRKRGHVPKGVDQDSTWGFSKHHGWVQGYSYEVVVTAAKKGPVLPLLASVDTASASEHVTFGPKIPHLPPEVRNVLTDAGYDSNEYGDRIEYDDDGRSTGRHFICPPNLRGKPGRSPPRTLAQRRRHKRKTFFGSPTGQRLHARRTPTAEPFNEWFKSLFELSDRAWHRGLDNNRTQILAALCCYQLLLRFNRRRGRHNGQIQWILDTL